MSLTIRQPHFVDNTNVLKKLNFMKLIVFSCIVIGDLHVFSSYQKNSHYFAENLLLTQGRRYI